MLRENGIEAYVLQLGPEGNPSVMGADSWLQPIRFLNEEHLYAPVPQLSASYQQTRFFYGSWLRKYTNRLREIYQIAVNQWGKPDIIHAHVSLPGGYVAASLGKEFNIPVVVQEHYTGFESDARFPWRTGHFVREMGRRIQGFYAVSPGYAERIRRTGLVRVTGVLPNPIDTGFFVPARCGSNGKPFKIVTAGNMDRRKGTDLLLEALRLLIPKLDWHLTIFGDTSQSARFAHWLHDRQFSARVSLPGKVPQSELATAYCGSDLYVVSSRIETANVSMLEAMACGIPVVTTSCGAPETLIDCSVGVAVDNNNPKSLADGILEVAQASERYQPSILRQFVIDRYSKSVVFRLVLEAYQRAIVEKQK